MTLTLWGRASSVNVQKVLWALDELGAPYNRHDAGGKYGRTDTAEFAAMNPNRRVPVLQDGNFCLWESQAILRYLARRHTGLYPADPEGRARADQWMAYCDTTLQPPFITLFWQYVRLPQTQRDPAATDAARSNLGAALAVLDGHLRHHDWLTGAEFGIADIPAGSLMHRIHALDLMPAGLAGVERWAAVLAERPAYQAHVATSFDELRGN
ncbi:MAG: glutathione S-transferase [Rhodobacteraceae bacterium HLUCCA12]|nr:MAG: glutathione S-transferase [Rhodobacteraceae bacterium HLUCCA12]